MSDNPFSPWDWSGPSLVPLFAHARERFRINGTCSEYSEPYEYLWNTEFADSNRTAQGYRLILWLCDFCRPETYEEMLEVLDAAIDIARMEHHDTIKRRKLEAKAAEAIEREMADLLST